MPTRSSTGESDEPRPRCDRRLLGRARRGAHDPRRPAGRARRRRRDRSAPRSRVASDGLPRPARRRHPAQGARGRRQGRAAARAPRTSRRPTTTCSSSTARSRSRSTSRVQYARPSIDVLLQTAAEAYRERCVGVVLTGANADGALRPRARSPSSAARRSCRTPTTAERDEMPRAALARVPAATVAPVGEIAPAARRALRAHEGDGRLMPRPRFCSSTTGPQNLLALEAILDPLGYEPRQGADRAAEALRILLHRDDFAVILLDVQMPGMDGFEAAEADQAARADAARSRSSS